MVQVVGLHPRGHDSAVIVFDVVNHSVFASAYERLTRKKHDARLPLPLLRRLAEKDNELVFAISVSDVTGADLDYFDLSHRWHEDLRNLRGRKKWFRMFANLNPVLVLKRLRLKALRRVVSRGRDQEAFVKSLESRLPDAKIACEFYDHHTCHAASAYYSASEKFKENCVIITLDGQGDNSFSKIFSVSDDELHEVATSLPESSVPLLYSIVTSALGFAANSDEGKVEALAAFGNLTQTNPVRQILDEAFFITSSLEIQHRATTHFPFSDVSGEWAKLHRYFRGLTQQYGLNDVAAGMQSFYEDFLLGYVRHVQSHLQAPRACFAGGGFANVKLNRRVFEAEVFEDLFIYPAMGDDGAALGALTLSERRRGADIEWLRAQTMPYFGDNFGLAEVQAILDERSHLLDVEYVGPSYHRAVAEDIWSGRICAHFRGAMEFGPRALGNRSILANPLLAEVRNDLNLKFKQREWFQPFCPSMLEEEASRLFDKVYLNRHMTTAFTMRQEFWDVLPGIVHVDGTARAQFVDPSENPDFWRIIEEFKKLSNFGVLLNTSFNLHGRTIVRTPKDALDDFLDCGIDVLFIEGYRVSRKASVD